MNKGPEERIFEALDVTKYPELTHCMAIDESPGLSFTILVTDYEGNDIELVVPNEAIIKISLPLNTYLLRCRLTKIPIDNTGITEIEIPTTNGTKKVSILTKYIARK